MKNDFRKLELKPKCLAGKQAPALTATGYILPCCWLDNREVWNDPEVKKLFQTKKISEVENVEEIVNSVEWKNFINLLLTKSEKIPKTCYIKCTNDVDINPNRVKEILNKDELLND